MCYCWKCLFTTTYIFSIFFCKYIMSYFFPRKIKFQKNIPLIMRKKEAEVYREFPGSDKIITMSIFFFLIFVLKIDNNFKFNMIYFYKCFLFYAFFIFTWILMFHVSYDIFDGVFSGVRLFVSRELFMVLWLIILSIIIVFFYIFL